MGLETYVVGRRGFTKLLVGGAMALGAEAELPRTTQAAPVIQAAHPVDELRRWVDHFGNSPLSFEDAKNLLVPVSKFYGYLESNDGSDMLSRTFIVRRNSPSPADQMIKDYPDANFSEEELRKTRSHAKQFLGWVNNRMFVVLDNNIGHSFKLTDEGLILSKYDWQFEGEGPTVHCAEATSVVRLISIAGHEHQHDIASKRYQKPSFRLAESLQKYSSRFNGQIEFRSFIFRVKNPETDAFSTYSIQNEFLNDYLSKGKLTDVIPYVIANATPAHYANLRSIFTQANISDRELEEYTKNNQLDAFYTELGEGDIDKGVLLLPPDKRTFTSGPWVYIDSNASSASIEKENGCVLQKS